MRRRKEAGTLAPSVFARRASDYFRECDQGRPSAACDKCDTYFGDAKCDTCVKKLTRPYTLSGLCLALDITKKEFEMLKTNANYSGEVEMALLKIEAFIEENSISGRINGTLALAILRENFGWGEKPPADEKPKETFEVVLSKEAKRLAD